MLVLGRPKGKSVVIGKGKQAIVITILEIRDNHVRLGFECDDGVEIHRAEIYEKIHGELPQK